MSLPKKKNVKKIQNENNNQVTFELVNNKQNLIDTKDVKKSFSNNGINVYNVENMVSGMDCGSKDKVKFCVREQDMNSAQFQRVKRNLERQGFQMSKQTKDPYNKQETKDIIKVQTNNNKHNAPIIYINHKLINNKLFILSFPL